MSAPARRKLAGPILGLVFFAALLAAPGLVKSPYTLHVMILLFLWTALGESWNIIGGYGGQYSVGHAAYFGTGAYVTMLLLQYRQIGPWWGIWAAIAAAAVVAIIIGSICFRLRGPYFVLASIAVAEILRLAVLNWKSVTNGAEGILVTELPPLVVFGHTITAFDSKVSFYYFALGVAAATVIVNFVVKNSRLGYYLQAIREDQDAAHSLGIPLARYKNSGLVLSAMFTAVGGSFYAVYVGFVDTTTVLAIDLSVQIVLICIIGGIGTILGPVVGALVLVPLSEALRANVIAKALIGAGIISETSAAGVFIKENLAHAHVLIYGILVVLVILYMPDGVLGYVRGLLARRARRAARAATPAASPPSVEAR